VHRVIVAPDHIKWGEHTIGKTPLFEGSARHGDLYLTTHNIQDRLASMAPAGFESAIPGGEQAQINAVDIAATGIDLVDCITQTIQFRWRLKFLKLLLRNFTRTSVSFCLLRTFADLKHGLGPTFRGTMMFCVIIYAQIEITWVKRTTTACLCAGKSLDKQFSVTLSILINPSLSNISSLKNNSQL
jgi:hypothetical protein